MSGHNQTRGAAAAMALRSPYYYSKRFGSTDSNSVCMYCTCTTSSVHYIRGRARHPPSRRMIRDLDFRESNYLMPTNKLILICHHISPRDRVAAPSPRYSWSQIRVVFLMRGKPGNTSTPRNYRVVTWELWPSVE